MVCGGVCLRVREDEGGTGAQNFRSGVERRGIGAHLEVPGVGQAPDVLNPSAAALGGRLSQGESVGGPEHRLFVQLEDHSASSACVVDDACLRGLIIRRLTGAGHFFLLRKLVPKISSERAARCASKELCAGAREDVEVLSGVGFSGGGLPV